MSEKSMERAIDVLAGHLARKAAKRKGTTSENWIEGYKEAVVFCAKNPMPEGVELVAALGTAKLPEKPKPVVVAE